MRKTLRAINAIGWIITFIALGGPDSDYSQTSRFFMTAVPWFVLDRLLQVQFTPAKRRPETPPPQTSPKDKPKG